MVLSEELCILSSCFLGPMLSFLFVCLFDGLFVRHRSTQPCIPPGSLNRVPASAGLKAGMSPLPGGR